MWLHELIDITNPRLEAAAVTLIMTLLAGVISSPFYWIWFVYGAGPCPEDHVDEDDPPPAPDEAAFVTIPAVIDHADMPDDNDRDHGDLEAELYLQTPNHDFNMGERARRLRNWKRLFASAGVPLATIFLLLSGMPFWGSVFYGALSTPIFLFLGGHIGAVARPYPY